jgi:hypothetical protein
MMLNNGVHGNERLLSRPSVELMTTDHITPEQKAASANPSSLATGTPVAGASASPS